MLAAFLNWTFLGKGWFFQHIWVYTEGVLKWCLRMCWSTFCIFRCVCIGMYVLQVRGVIAFQIVKPCETSRAKDWCCPGFLWVVILMPGLLLSCTAFLWPTWSQRPWQKSISFVHSLQLYCYCLIFQFGDTFALSHFYFHGFPPFGTPTMAMQNM